MHKLLDETWTPIIQDIVYIKDESIDQEFGLDNISKSQWMKELPQSADLARERKELEILEAQV